VATGDGVVKILLEGAAIKEIFDQYATPAMRDEVRKKIQAGMDDLIKEEIKKKTESYVTSNKIEAMLQSVLIGNITSFRSRLPNDEEKRILVEAFKSRANKLDFEKMEELLLDEARVMVEEKMLRYKKLMKEIVENI